MRVKLVLDKIMILIMMYCDIDRGLLYHVTHWSCWCYKKDEKTIERLMWQTPLYIGVPSQDVLFVTDHDLMITQVMFSLVEFAAGLDESSVQA